MLKVWKSQAEKSRSLQLQELSIKMPLLLFLMSLLQLLIQLQNLKFIANLIRLSVQKQPYSFHTDFHPADFAKGYWYSIKEKLFSAEHMMSFFKTGMENTMNYGMLRHNTTNNMQKGRNSN